MYTAQKRKIPNTENLAVPTERHPLIPLKTAKNRISTARPLFECYFCDAKFPVITLANIVWLC